MQLAHDWRRVLRYAWSVRFQALAVVFTGLEVVLPYFGDFIEPGRLALLSALSTAAAFIARLVAQRNMKDEA